MRCAGERVQVYDNRIKEANKVTAHRREVMNFKKKVSHYFRGNDSKEFKIILI